MSKNRRLLNIITFLIIILIGQNLWAQSTASGSQHFEQKLQWQADRNAFEYKVEVRPVSGGSSTFVTTANTSVSVNLGAGDYQYRVYTYDFLGRESSVSEWRKFSVVKAVAPAITETPKQVAAAVDKNKPVDVPVEVKNIEEDSVVELINTETNQVIKGTLITEKAGGEVVAASAEFPKVSEGDWKLKVTNPSGLSSESSVFEIADQKKIQEAEKAALAEAEKQRKQAEAEEKKRLEEEAKAKAAEEKQAQADRKAQEKQAEADRKAEEKRLAEEQKKAEADKKLAEAEEKKRLEEEAKQKALEEKLAAEEEKRAEAQRKVDEAAEKKRQAQEEIQARKDAAAQRAKEAEEKRLADEQARKERQAEMKRQAQERAQQAKEREEKARIAEQLHQEAEKLRKEEEKIAKAEEEARLKEEKKEQQKAEREEKRANRKFFDINVQAGMGTFTNIYDRTLFSYTTSTFSDTLNARISYLPIDVFNMKFGFEVNGMATYIKGSNQYFTLQMPMGMANLCTVGQFPLIKDRLFIRTRLGAGISVINIKTSYHGENSQNRKKNTADYYGYICAQTGVGLHWQITRFLVLETGFDFSHIFINNMPTGSVNPYLTGGIRL